MKKDDLMEIIASLVEDGDTEFEKLCAYYVYEQGGKETIHKLLRILKDKEKYPEFKKIIYEYDSSTEK